MFDYRIDTSYLWFPINKSDHPIDVFRCIRMFKVCRSLKHSVIFYEKLNKITCYLTRAIDYPSIGRHWLSGRDLRTLVKHNRKKWLGISLLNFSSKKKNNAICLVGRECRIFCITKYWSSWEQFCLSCKSLKSWISSCRHLPRDFSWPSISREMLDARMLETWGIIA